MIPLPLDELHGLGRLEGEPAAVTGVEIDSRRVGEGDLFVAVRGGVAYLDDARAHGAAATLVPDDDFAALAAIGRAVRTRIGARIVAITGSVGKTSTKDILASLLRAAHANVVAAEDGFNNEVGFRLRSAVSSTTPTSSSRRWGCAASTRSARSRRSRGRTSV